MISIHTRILVILASVALGFAPNAWAIDAKLPQLAAKPSAMPELHYLNEAGNSVVFKPAGKLTLLHFWATWCIPCTVELPQIDKVAGDYAAKGLTVVPLSLDTKMDKVKQFFADHKIAHLTANIDDKSAAFQALKVGGLPATIFINSQGEEIGRAEGPVLWADPKTAEFLDKALAP